jgi:hypothetical protein
VWRPEEKGEEAPPADGVARIADLRGVLDLIEGRH